MFNKKLILMILGIIMLSSLSTGAEFGYNYLEDPNSFFGEVTFDGGWEEGGCTITDGDIYCDTAYLYNISTLNIDEVNLTVLVGMDVKGNFTVDNPLFHVDSINNKVGIGTTSPSQLLDLSGGSIRLDNGESLRWDGGSYRIEGKDTEPNARIGFVVEGSEAMRVDNTGNVGIGTTSPDANLNIEASTGAEFLVTNTGNNGVTIRGDSNRTSAGVTLVDWDARWDGTRVATISIKSGDDTTNKDNAEMAFLTAESGSLSEAMRIDKDGNVGIGTSSPSHPLHVYKSANQLLKLERSSTGGAWMDIANTEGNFSLGTHSGAFRIFDRADNINRFIIDTSGNVGIGTMSPRSLLNIEDTTTPGGVLTLENADASVSANDIIGQLDWYMNDANANSAGVFARIDAYAPSAVDGQADDGIGLRFYTALTDGNGLQERMKINRAGKVGIGTTSPANPLEVSSGTADAPARFSSTDDLTRIAFEDDAGTSYLGKSSDSGVMWMGSNSGVNAVNFNIELSTGNIGIGTTSPAHELEISSASPVARLTDSDGSNQYIEIQESNGVGYFDTRSGTSDGQFHFRKYDGGTYDTIMFMKGDGNVGIGTTAPLAKTHIYTGASGRPGFNGAANELVVEGSGNSGLTIATPDANQGWILFADATADNSGGIFYDHPNNGMGFRVNGGTRVTFDNNGNVGIGTTSPTHRLNIVGALNVTNNAFIENNVTLGSGAVFWSNETCAYISSPDGSNRLEVCNS